MATASPLWSWEASGGHEEGGSDCVSPAHTRPCDSRVSWGGCVTPSSDSKLLHSTRDTLGNTSMSWATSRCQPRPGLSQGLGSCVLGQELPGCHPPSAFSLFSRPDQAPQSPLSLLCQSLLSLLPILQAPGAFGPSVNETSPFLHKTADKGLRSGLRTSLDTRAPLHLGQDSSAERTSSSHSAHSYTISTDPGQVPSGAEPLL